MSGVCVIIAAMNASSTIGRAVRSALAQDEVTQVIVVDDGSTDATSGAARAAGDGSRRLLVERLPANRGPSAARNRALSLAEAPYIAVLDSDDMFLPGRFARLLAIPDWDIIADNILFVPEAMFVSLDEIAVPASGHAVRELDLRGLIEGSGSRFSTGRTQLGFLKPVFRRDAFEQAALQYDETVRLGEDSILYAGLLAAGARFLVVSTAGYLAVERGASLSARHRCEDLAALLTAEQALVDRIGPGPAGEAMRRRARDTRRKWALRHFLESKRAHGLGGALADLRRRPQDWTGVAEGLLLDKVRAGRRGFAADRPQGGLRLLMPLDPGTRS